MALTADQQNFIKEIAPLAIKSWNDTHIVIPSVTIAQGILESGWGTTELARKANNLFGIKTGTTWKGESYSINTTEYVNGKKITVKAAFRKYPNRQQSVDDHTTFLTKERYKACWGVTDARKSISAIHKAGYATDPSYTDKVMKIINTYNLTQYDNQATPVQPANPTPAPTPTNNGKKLMYAVQTGAYSKKANADAMLKKVRSKGYKDAYIVYISNDKYYRVQLGSFSVKANAEKLKAEVIKKGFQAIVKEKYL